MDKTAVLNICGPFGLDYDGVQQVAAEKMPYGNYKPAAPGHDVFLYSIDERDGGGSLMVVFDNNVVTEVDSFGGRPGSLSGEGIALGRSPMATSSNASFPDFNNPEVRQQAKENYERFQREDQARLDSFR